MGTCHISFYTEPYFIASGGGGGGGTVTYVALTSSDLLVTGSPITTTGTIVANLKTSGVTANTYGSATQIPIITVNNKGIVTNATTTNVSVPLTDTHILVGNGSNVATDVALSGDATITNTGVLTLNNQSVTFAKIQNIATSRILGRSTAGSGVVEELSIGTGLSLSGGILSATGLSNTLTDTYIYVGNGSNVATAVAVSGDVTLANTGAMTIGNQAVTFAKFQNIATNRLIGRSTAGNGSMEELNIGSGLSLTGGTLSCTVAGGTVTSVGISSTDLSVANSPITTSGTITLDINNSAVTFAKIQNIATSRILGRSTAGSGVVEELSIGSGLSLSAGTLSATGLSSTLTDTYIYVGNGSNVATAVAVSGDVTLANTGAITIANQAVTFAKMQNLAANSLMGRWTASTGSPEQITVGSGLTLAGGVLSATAGGGGTVTSVDMTVPTSILSVTGNPITTSGTLAVTLATQNANKVWAGPTTGADAAPTFRVLVNDDLPTGIDATKIANGTVTNSAFQRISGLTSDAQTQINNKQDTITGAATSITSANLTASRALVSDSAGKVAVSTVTSTELALLSGKTSIGTVTSVGLSSTDLSVSGSPVTSSGSITLNINNSAVTFAKMQNISTAKLLGRGTAGTGDIEEITLGTGLSFSGTTLNATGGSLTNWTESTNTYSSQVGVRFLATNAGTNVDAVISPKGTGAFYLGAYADGTATGGNNRGLYALDLGFRRSSANQVASGENSVNLKQYGRASGEGSLNAASFGHASGQFSMNLSNSGTASGTYSINAAVSGTASGTYSSAFGQNTVASLYGERAYRATDYGLQYSEVVFSGVTLDATPKEIYLDGTGGSSRLVLTSNSVNLINFEITARKNSDNSAVTMTRRATFKKDTTAGSTSLVGSVQTIGTDQNAAGLSISITADTTNGSVKVEVTGDADMWIWGIYTTITRNGN